MPHPIRSILFAPANQEHFLRKFPSIQADVAIACLEDGTPVDEKESSRKLASDTLSALRADGWHGQVYLRINPLGSEFFEGDVACAVEGAFDGIVIPKVGTGDDVSAVLEAMGPAGGTLPVILGIESGLGVVNIEEVLSVPCHAVGAYFGAEDYATSIGSTRSDSNEEVAYARARVALYARVWDLSAFDCGTLAIKDDDRFRRECSEARGFGYTGKICLNPRQVELAHELFMPSSHEVAYSRRLLATYQKALADGRATPAIDGLMIDGPLVKRAEAILALADV